jgi:hypothetical protein
MVVLLETDFQRDVCRIVANVEIIVVDVNFVRASMNLSGNSPQPQIIPRCNMHKTQR